MPQTVYSRLFAPHAGKTTSFLILDNAVVTHGAFLAEVARVAGALRAAGVAPGDRVAMQVPKCTRALALYGATALLGAVLLPLNTGYTPNEVQYFVEDARPSLLVCAPGSAAALAPIAASVGAAVLTLDADGEGTLAAAMDTAEAVTEPHPSAPEDLAAILYTSGTTGRSKGAMLSHANLISNAEALAALWAFTADDVLIHALPIFHTHGLFVAINIALLVGCPLRFFPKFDADAVAAALPQSTAMMGVPTFYTRLLESAGLTREAVTNMRLFVSGSAPLLAETHRQFEAATGHRILERYGMTETNMNTSNPYEGARKPGTVGLPLPGIEVRVVDPETREALPRGEIGMVEVRGPNVFQGYWNMPEKTAEELKADGFFVTGDLGQIDQDGYLVIVGRGKDLIIAGGYNIYPKEIELALDDLPGVLESAVIGVPHPDMGEGVAAVVVPEPGAVLEPEVLLAALTKDLASFKRPRRLFMVDALPRNTMGKVQKAALREAYAGAFASV